MAGQKKPETGWGDDLLANFSGRRRGRSVLARISSGSVLPLVTDFSLEGSVDGGGSESGRETLG